jgi:EAL domain-containing protein (putative c-di-GMP-specific phosphodiesterase class I)
MALGHSMDINVVAKGIETLGQRDFLVAEGCIQGQGYYYSQPLSSEHLQQQWPH